MTTALRFASSAVVSGARRGQPMALLLIRSTWTCQSPGQEEDSPGRNNAARLCLRVRGRWEVL